MYRQISGRMAYSAILRYTAGKLAGSHKQYAVYTRVAPEFSANFTEGRAPSLSLPISEYFRKGARRRSEGSPAATDTMSLIIRPIAHIRTDFPSKFGVPRQSGRAPSLVGTVVFEPEFRDESALRGLEGFSHLWLIFDFSEAHRETWSPTVRPPRLGGNTRMGVFATRSPFRPNPIGLSSVRLCAVERTAHDGTVLRVAGADLTDGTPILDIKPYIPFTDSHPDASAGFAAAGEDHRLAVDFPAHLLRRVPQDKRAALSECLADDPRPSYQDDARVYTMPFASMQIDFTVSGDVLRVVDVRE